MPEEKLAREFYLRDAVTVARELLGARLVCVLDGERMVAEITETEAYCGVADRACHAWGGRRTARTETLYMRGGHAYVYLIYGMYDLFNVVVREAGDPCAVLVRGGRVLEGGEAVARRRHGRPLAELTPKQRRGLLDGPGRFCRGLGITRALDRADLLGDALYLSAGRRDGFTVGTGPRIGIDYAGEDALLPYRFFMEDEPERV